MIVLAVGDFQWVFHLTWTYSSGSASAKGNADTDFRNQWRGCSLLKIATQRVALARPVPDHRLATVLSEKQTAPERAPLALVGLAA
jgi:hypothetical protein